ncbi:MAG: tetratricopeptide repeat protein [Magnetococcus sp. DMHC-1]
MQNLTAVLKIRPNFPPAHLERGLLHLQQGSMNSALQDFSAAIRLDPKFYDAYFLRAELLGRTGKIKEALADINQALQLRPNNPTAIFRRGLFQVALGEVASGIVGFERARQLAPGDPQIPAGLGLAHFIQGSHAAAEEAFLQSLSLAPDDVFVILWLTLTRLKQNPAADRAALPQVESARLTQWPNPLRALLLGNMTPDGVMQQARQTEKAGVAMALVESSFFIGQYHLLHNNTTEAAVWLRKSLEFDAKDPILVHLANKDLNRLSVTMPQALSQVTTQETSSITLPETSSGTVPGTLSDIPSETSPATASETLPETPPEKPLQADITSHQVLPLLSASFLSNPEILPQTTFTPTPVPLQASDQESHAVETAPFLPDKNPGSSQTNNSDPPQEKDSGSSQTKNSRSAQEKYPGLPQAKNAESLQAQDSGSSQEKHSGIPQGMDAESLQKQDSGSPQEKYPGLPQGKNAKSLQTQDSKSSQEKNSGIPQGKNAGSLRAQNSRSSQENTSGPPQKNNAGPFQTKDSKPDQEKNPDSSQEKYSGLPQENNTGPFQAEDSGFSAKNSDPSRENNSASPQTINREKSQKIMIADTGTTHAPAGDAPEKRVIVNQENHAQTGSSTPGEWPNATDKAAVSILLTDSLSTDIPAIVKYFRKSGLGKKARDLHLFRTRNNRTLVYYGTFPSVADAQEQIRNMSPVLRKNQPRIHSLARIEKRLKMLEATPAPFSSD